MLVVRNRPKGARFASFGLGLCVFALIPTEIGYQDIASLLARQPGVAERWQKRVFSAASAIRDLLSDLTARNVTIVFGRVSPFLRADMDRHGITAAASADHIFTTLHEAVAAAHTVLDTQPPGPGA